MNLKSDMRYELVLDWNTVDKIGEDVGRAALGVGVVGPVVGIAVVPIRCGTHMDLREGDERNDIRYDKREDRLHGARGQVRGEHRDVQSNAGDVGSGG